MSRPGKKKGHEEERGDFSSSESNQETRCRVKRGCMRKNVKSIKWRRGEAFPRGNTSKRDISHQLQTGSQTGVCCVRNAQRPVQADR